MVRQEPLPEAQLRGDEDRAAPEAMGGEGGKGGKRTAVET